MPAYSKLIRHVATQHRLIALTFDDGPSPNCTPQLLDLLLEFEAKATFFVLGERLELYPEIARRAVSEGHELGNHTYHHENLTFLSSKKQKAELELAHNLIIQLVGVTPCLFRPPYGTYNDSVLKNAFKKGYEVIMWHKAHDVRDWELPGVERMVNKICKQANNGEIILLHDGGGEDRSQTLEAVRRVLPLLSERGYRFVTVSQLLKMK